MSLLQKRQHETDSSSSESEDSVSVDSVVESKPKTKNKTKVERKQCYLKSYSSKWSCLTSSSRGPEYVYCLVCKSTFSCAHGGRYDCGKHVKGHTHQKLLKGDVGNRSIMAALASQSSKSSEDLTLQVTRAETMMCRMVADGNMSMSLGERLVPIMKMFPDSKIAAGLQLGRTKETVLLKEMSSMAMKELADVMKTRPFSITTDGSNEGEKKQFPLVIRSFSKGDDGSLQPVTTQLLGLRNCEGSATGKNIFEVVDSELDNQGAPGTTV